MARPTLKGKLLHPSKYLAAEELRGPDGKPRDFTLTIKSVALEELTRETEESESVPIIRFVETEKAMCLNRTNAETIADLHGTEADNWAGKRITIYPTKVKAFGTMTPCIRVRDTLPLDSATAPATTGDKPNAN